MRRGRWVLAALAGAVVGVVACSGPSSSGGFKGAGGTGGASGASGSGGAGGGGGSGLKLGGPEAGADTGEGILPDCTAQNSIDHDHDGWSYLQGDCNDCDPLINPGAYDIPGDGIDEDCDGKIDDEPTGCDTGLSLTSNAPSDGAKAMDLCRQTTAGATGPAKTWGVLSAAYVLPDGTTTPSKNFPLGVGLLPSFGVNKPEEGVTMLALSSGTGRSPSQAGWIDPGLPYDGSFGGFEKGFTSDGPAGYPKPAPACPDVAFGQPNDGASLKLVIRVPTNAKTLSFEENFFSIEFPAYICHDFNDTFVVMMSPKTDPSLPDGNIASDSMGNPISVNNALLQVCTPQTAGGKSFACPLGPASLAGTGFEEKNNMGPHAATGWLTTTAPVESVKGQDITLLFAIWDSYDANLDSTVLVDHFTWGFYPPMGGAVTMPSPPPK